MKSQNTQICLEILTLWRQIKTTIAEFAAEHDLTLQQIFVLYHLYGEDCILMGTLARQMHCDASNVTGMVDRLQTAGFIVRRELPEDRRAKQLAITPQGRALIDKLLPRLPQGLHLDRLTTNDQQVLLTTLAGLAK